MLAMYQSGNPYLAYCHAIGVIPRDGTKKTHFDIYFRYKTMMLAVQYGMQAATLAARLGVSVFEAALMLEQHREQFAQYWTWSNDFIQQAMQNGVMRTVFGWRCRTGETEFNERSFRNWPIQAVGSEILRIACILGVRHGIRLIAPNHDAVLIEAPSEKIEADAALMQEIMRRASRIALNRDRAGGHELRTDCTIVRYPNRYVDERGVTMWAHVTAHRVAAAKEDCLMGDAAGDEQILAELYARAPAKRKRSKESFIQVPLDRVAAAAKATNGRKMLVWLLILHRCWKENKRTVPVTNELVGKYGISSKAKTRALQQLERAGLITVEWRGRRNPIVTKIG
jgi:hypothetical protein